MLEELTSFLLNRWLNFSIQLGYHLWSSVLRLVHAFSSLANFQTVITVNKRFFETVLLYNRTGNVYKVATIEVISERTEVNDRGGQRVERSTELWKYSIIRLACLELSLATFMWSDCTRALTRTHTPSPTQSSSHLTLHLDVY